jgi:hypothetical protein
MASRQNLNNRSNAFKGAGGALSKVYGAAQKQIKKRRAQPTISEQPAGELSGERRETGGFRDMGSAGVAIGERDPTGAGQVQIAPDFREHMQRAEEQRRRTTAPPAPTQPPIQQGPGYEQRDEPVFDQSAIATEEQIPGQSTPLPPPSTATNVSNRLARNRVTARQPTEEIPPDSPRSRGMRGRR